MGNSSKCISRQFVSPNPLRAWPLRDLRLGGNPSFGAVLVAPRKSESHRKGAKDAKGDSHASNSKLLVDSKKSESGSFPERTTVDDLPTSWSVFLRVSASPWLASAVFGWIAA